MFFALFFIILGVVFLLKNLGIISAGTWGIIWPSVLILFGVWLAWKKYEWKKWRERIWAKLGE